MSDRKETIYYFGFGALTLLFASLPYLYGVLNVPAGHVYTGLTYNIDDVCVYLAWMRQAADGHLFQRNLFTTEAQQGNVINVFSLLLGTVARFTGLSLVAVYHLARVGFGALLLAAAARLLRETIADERARRIGYALLCLSAGLGWLTGGYDPAKAYTQPIDLWQPEAITFLSLYYTPLFLAALALIVVFVTAIVRVERSGLLRDIWPAAVAGALLANFHTYDVITLFVVGIIYRAIQDILARRIDIRRWLGLVVAGIATLPSLAYTYFSLIRDPIFASRDVKTTTTSPVWIALGFGLTLLFAMIALGRQRTDAAQYRDAVSVRLLMVWMVCGLLLPYAPVDFQRKLLMGIHLPLCLLAGVSLSTLTNRLSGDFPKIAAGFAVLLTIPSSALFLMQDIGRLSLNAGSTAARPYLTTGEVEALNWLRTNTTRQDAVLVSPDPTSHRRFPFLPLAPYLSVDVPAYTGNPVYIGHGSETAAYGRKIGEMWRFFRQETPDEWRATFLKESGVHYVLYANTLADGTPTDPQGNPVLGGDGQPYVPVAWSKDNPPSFLKPAFQNADVTVYAVTNP